MKKMLLTALAAAVLAACNSENATQQDTTPAATEQVQKTLLSGIEFSNIDKAVRAQDDLYRHVNGHWLEHTVIPADKSNYGSFTKLADDAEVQLRAIIEESAKANAEAGSERQKVGDFYNSFMNTELLEQRGMEPIKPHLAEVDALKDKNELVAWFGNASRAGVRTPLVMFINQDKKDATRYAAYFYQSGIGLPDRDFYFKDDEKSKNIRDAYLKHIETMMTLAGFDKPAEAAKKVYAVEEKLANGHWARVDNRDPVKTYNKVEIAKLNEMSGDVNWGNWVNALGLGNEKEVIVYQPSYVTAMGEALKTVSLDDWKLYAKYQIVSGAAPLLSKAFDEAHFNFYSKTLRGVEQQQERWKRAVQFTDDVIGEAVGKIYVEKHFPPEAKARMEKLVQNLLLAFGQGIDGLEWMTDDTKKAAREKLSKFTYKIGYPDKWRDYSALEIKGDDLFGNALRATEFEYNRNLNKLGKPIDRSEWFMTPQTVNAYYNPVANEIVFPAAILQPPFFNLAADDAVNYGGIGAVIGHEIGHGFDDSGSQYDGDGNLRNWWTDTDRAEFEKRTAVLVEQYNKFEPLPGKNVNGKLTLGENIGDLGGLTIAYKAYQLSLNGQPAPEMDGLTGDQRFFMGWAQVWARKYRDEELLQRLVTDSHSPSEYRCNGIVANMPEFYAAFGIKEGDKLYLPPEQRVKIW
ncbi:M13 family metallopeptidase [Permianibacter aggregans]|uniref:Type IV secretion system putative lipoprotein virB7 n=1 Tax=Permianibacter aggregans TaxID=1510150 RepID=A0A4R6UL56_9GAMM|nr:M13-type metalloendopeptidase [Permianibacter aggregans]QGX39174.1 M13 family peptidase [Permianibacter aggregans]TDQ47611.1 endothelin-converting enzyme [Permianibacter aggregans]